MIYILKVVEFGQGIPDFGIVLGATDRAEVAGMWEEFECNGYEFVAIPIAENKLVDKQDWPAGLTDVYKKIRRKMYEE